MLWKNAFAAVICGLFFALSSAPAQAAQQWDWDCWCWKETGGGSSGGSSTSYTASNGAKYSILTETVAYTGRTHLVLIQKGGFFPERVYADPGDRVLFVNKSGSSVTVEATNTSWTSNALSNGSAYLLLVQSGLHANFRDKATCSWNNCSSKMSGEVRIAALPSQARYWEDTMGITTMLPKFGLSTSVLTNAITFVGNLQAANGLVKSVTGLL